LRHKREPGAPDGDHARHKRELKAPGGGHARHKREPDAPPDDHARQKRGTKPGVGSAGCKRNLEEAGAGQVRRGAPGAGRGRWEGSGAANGRGWHVGQRGGLGRSTVGKFGACGRHARLSTGGKGGGAGQPIALGGWGLADHSRERRAAARAMQLRRGEKAGATPKSAGTARPRTGKGVQRRFKMASASRSDAAGGAVSRKRDGSVSSSSSRSGSPSGPSIRSTRA
jgi:hypothetical protein